MNQNGSMNAKEFKGIYYNDNKQQKFYEGGAHFNYKELFHLLEDLQSVRKKIESNSQRAKPKTRNAKSTNDFKPNISHSNHIQTFDISKHSSVAGHFQFNQRMNLSMYNKRHKVEEKNQEEEEEAIVPQKQISIVKSTHSNTRNSHNNYDKDKDKEHNTTNKLLGMSLCSVNKRESQYNRYTSKEKKIIIPAQVLVQQMITNSNKMLHFTSRIKENLSKPKTIQIQQHQPPKQYFKQNSQRNKISSIDFDQIGLYKKSDVAKSRNQYSQRNHRILNANNNNSNSFMRGSSVDKQPIGKTIDSGISRNKICYAISISSKQKTSLGNNYKNRPCRVNSTIKELSRNNNNELNYNNTSSKECPQMPFAHTNYAQKYLKKILRNSFEISKRIQSSTKQSNHNK